MTKHNPFDITSSNLGDNIAGIDRLGVDELFSSTHLNTAPTCIICQNPAHYKLIPKHKRLANAEIESRGYICMYCVSQKHVSPDDYRLTEL